MKKLMVAVVAMAAGAAMADIVSSSVVGYAQPATTQQSVSWVPMFTPVAGFQATYALNDFSVTGMQPGADSIQFLDPDTAETYFEAVYLDEDTYGAELAGWWDPTGDFTSPEYKVGTQTFAYGTSFLAAFTSGEQITFLYSGAVLGEAKSFTYESQSVFFGNYLPKDLTLAQITATGMQPGADSIQFLDPDTAETYFEAVYLDAETYGAELAGWWDPTGDFASPEYRLDTTPVPAGQGFLAAFTSGEAITFTFPAAY